MRNFVIILILSMSMAASEATVVRKAVYHQVEGTDVEYGQGAIERNELPHREVERNVWFVRVPEPGDCAVWAQRLSSAVEPEHGRFEVVPLTADEQARVDRGEIVFQQ